VKAIPSVTGKAADWPQNPARQVTSGERPMQISADANEKGGPRPGPPKIEPHTTTPVRLVMQLYRTDAVRQLIFRRNRRRDGVA
jgi:hypothetical protein